MLPKPANVDTETSGKVPSLIGRAVQPGESCWTYGAGGPAALTAAGVLAGQDVYVVVLVDPLADAVPAITVPPPVGMLQCQTGPAVMPTVTACTVGAKGGGDGVPRVTSLGPSVTAAHRAKNSAAERVIGFGLALTAATLAGFGDGRVAMTPATVPAISKMMAAAR